MPPKLDLSTSKALTGAIESRDASALAAPLISDPFSSSTLLPHIVSQLLVQALAKPQTIDDLVNLVLSSSAELQQAHPEHFNEVREASYFSAPLPDVQGLGKGLVALLVSELHTALLPQVQRAVTPPPEGDGLLSSAYYHRALSHGLFIGRLFALSGSAEQSGGAGVSVDARSSVWPVVEDVLRKGLLSPPSSSGSTPQPGSILVSCVLLHSSGLSLSKYLKPTGNVEGKGASYVWYDDKLKQPDLAWGWDEVVEKATGGLDLEGKLEPRQLSAYVERVARESARSPQDASSSDVAADFAWIADIPLSPSGGGNEGKSSGLPLLDAVALARSAELEKEVTRRLEKLAKLSEGIRFRHAASGLHSSPEKLEQVSSALDSIEEALQELRRS